jgi:hypothetical protein
MPNVCYSRILLLTHEFLPIVPYVKRTSDNEAVFGISNSNNNIAETLRHSRMAVQQFPQQFLMHLMMAKQAETVCGTDVLHKGVQLETGESLKFVNLEF